MLFTPHFRDGDADFLAVGNFERVAVGVGDESPIADRIA